MKLYYSLTFVLTFNCLIFSQTQKTYKPNTFKSLEPEFTLPEVELPENKLFLFSTKFGKIKKTTGNGKVTNYDKEGNIISDSITTYEGTEFSKYSYINGKLSEYSVLFTPNDKDIERQRKINEIDAEKQIKESGNAVVAEINAHKKETTYKAYYDQKGNIESYFWKLPTNDEKKYRVINHIIKYDKNKVVEINSDAEKEKLYYESDLLIKKEIIRTSNQSIETLNYFYTNFKKLHYITSQETYFKYQNKEVLKDSAAYDNKNRIVFHGYKSRYTTYTYDDKDNLTEENIYLNNSIYSKILYEYFDNKLIKKTQLSYDTKKKEYGTITEYFYLNDNLSEIKVETINIDINTKKIFTYNNLNQLISIKKLDYKKSDITNNIEKYSIETTIEYSTKKITIYHKNGYYVHYEFY